MSSVENMGSFAVFVHDRVVVVVVVVCVCVIERQTDRQTESEKT